MVFQLVGVVRSSSGRVRLTIAGVDLGQQLSVAKTRSPSLGETPVTTRPQTARPGNAPLPRYSRFTASCILSSIQMYYNSVCQAQDILIAIPLASLLPI